MLHSICKILPERIITGIREDLALTQGLLFVCLASCIEYTFQSLSVRVTSQSLKFYTPNIWQNKFTRAESLEGYGIPPEFNHCLKQKSVCFVA